MDKNIFHQISYGMYFVSTVDKNNKKVGCIINTLTQVTSENPLISINLNKNNYTNTAIKDTKKFIVSIISEKTKSKTIKTFGYQTSKETDKFKDINYELYENLPIILEDTIGYLVLETKQIIDCNTHDIIIAKVVDTKTLNDNQPMTYQFYHEVLKGTSPKNAPTFMNETNKHSKSKRYQCQICGHIYDDANEEIKFEDLPEDWICPICGVTKDNFKRIS